MSEETDEIRYEVAVGQRILAEMGLATGVRASLGHVSMRIPSDPGKFMVKGRGYRIDTLSRTRPEDVVTCDLEGHWLDGPEGSLPCAEVKIHSCAYKNRPDVQSVVHVHPKFTVIMGVLGVPLVPMVQEGILVVRTTLPVYPHTKVVTSEAEGQEVARLMGNGHAILLFGHGAVTVGTKVDESVLRMVQLEWQAEMNYWAYSAAGREHSRIPDELVEEVARGQSYAEPHFQERVAAVGRPRSGGIWPHYRELVTRDM